MQDLGHTDSRLLLAERANLLSEWGDQLIEEVSIDRTPAPAWLEQLEGLLG